MDVSGRVIRYTGEGQTDSQSINQSASHITLCNKSTSIKRNGHNLEYMFILNKPFVSQGQLVWLCGFDSFVIDDKYLNDIIINK